MARSFPADVLVLDSESLLHARFARSNKNPEIVQSKAWRLPASTFQPAPVTPDLADEAAFVEALRRMRLETGRWERASLLLPDAWFRMNLLELPSLPENEAEATEVIRWSLKRTLPIPPEELRIAYEVVSRTTSGARALVLSATDRTLSAIERVFDAAGFEVVLIEPVGMNIWNAIAVREPVTTKDRLFVYVRDTDFTTAVFRGTQPLFIRSRNLSAERTMQQEIRLSASYLRDTLQANDFEQCYLAASRFEELRSALTSEFQTPVQRIDVRDFIAPSSNILIDYSAELTACAGVFTG